MTSVTDPLGEVLWPAVPFPPGVGLSALRYA